jgi:hypothetical protein
VLRALCQSTRNVARTLRSRKRPPGAAAAKTLQKTIPSFSTKAEFERHGLPGKIPVSLRTVDDGDRLSQWQEPRNIRARDVLHKNSPHAAKAGLFRGQWVSP